MPGSAAGIQMVIHALGGVCAPGTFLLRLAQAFPRKYNKRGKQEDRTEQQEYCVRIPRISIQKFVHSLERLVCQRGYAKYCDQDIATNKRTEYGRNLLFEKGGRKHRKAEKKNEETRDRPYLARKARFIGLGRWKTTG